MNDDQKAVARALRGDETGYAELLSRYRDRVFSFLLRVVGDASDAEDLAQGAFLKAFHALDKYDPERPFLSWVFKIAHNTAFDHLRARRLDVPLDDEHLEIADPEPSVEAAVAAVYEAELVERALAALPAGYREVMLLRHKEELEYAQIAEITGLPEGTVKIRLFRGRDLLKGKLEALGLALKQNETFRAPRSYSVRGTKMKIDKDPIGAAISKMALRSPSRGFDERLISRLRVERMWRRALGFGVAWSAAGSAAVLALPFWIGLRVPTVAGLKLEAASAMIEAVRWLSLAGREASGLCAPCLAVELLGASLLAAGALALLAPKPVPSHGRMS